VRALQLDGMLPVAAPPVRPDLVSSTYATAPPTPPPRRTATRAKHSSKTSTASAAQTPPPVPPCASTYDIAYGGGETTVGLFSTETLTLKPGVTINNFRFGCGSHQRGKYDKFDGLLGLGGKPESLVSQTAEQYGRAFSYCLPPGKHTSGFLALGAASNNTAGFVFAPMRQFSNFPTFYVVSLTGISVGGKQLDILPAVFSNGMVIDSGTVITSLPATAYSALRSAFRSAMSAYPLLPPNDDIGLDTCYNFTGHSNVMVPKAALTFTGGTTIDPDVPSSVPRVHGRELG
jgi:hypothetical protein